MGACASAHHHLVQPRALPEVLGPSPSILPRRAFDDVHEHYTFDEELYRCDGGIVHRVTDKKTGMPHACKTFYKTRLCTLEELHGIQTHIKIRKHASVSGHPNVARWIQSFEDKTRVHVVTELCTGGDLFDRITDDSRNGLQTERATALAFHGVMAAIKHFHAMNVVHRDVRPENFMFVDGSATAAIKCIDFGSATWSLRGGCDIVGSPHYIAPELLLRDPTDNVPITGEIDVWSAGVMLYVMLCGFTPFNGTSNEALFESIVSDPLNLKSHPWPHISPAAKELVRKMLLRDPKRRFTPDQVLSHRWFAEQSAAREVPESVVLVRMRQFAQYSKFKKQALRVLAGGLPDAELEGMLRLFNAIDRDASGEITVRELRKALKKSGANMGITEVGTLLEGVDLDGNHIVDYGEFIAATMRDLAEGLSERDKADHLLSAFKHFDLDASGYITADELESVLRSEGQDVSTEEVHRMIHEADTDQDGKIDYIEFANHILTVDRQRLESRKHRVDNGSRKICIDHALSRKLRECTQAAACVGSDADGCGGLGCDPDAGAVSVASVALQNQLSGRSSGLTEGLQEQACGQPAAAAAASVSKCTSLDRPLGETLCLDLKQDEA